MTNRKLLVAPFLCGLIAIYSATWYFISQNMNGFLTKRMDIQQENIKLILHPFNIKFKIQDTRIESISFNLFSKKLLLKTRKEALNSLGLTKTMLKDIMNITYITFSTKLDSYFSLMKILQNKGTKFELIDAFNLLGDIGVTFKAEIYDPKLDMTTPISGDLEISLPNKRTYLNLDDIMSDLPQNLTLAGVYEIDYIGGSNSSAFLQKMIKFHYPIKSNIKLIASFTEKKIDIRNPTDETALEILNNININFLGSDDSQIALYKANGYIKPEDNMHHFNMDMNYIYKKGAMQNMSEYFMNNFVQEGGDEQIISIISSIFAFQPTNDTKLKFKLFCNHFIEDMKVALLKDPSYFKKYENMQIDTKISAFVPYKEGLGGMKYLLDIADNKEELAVKLEGSMSGNGIPEATKGVLYLDNSTHNISRFFGNIRLLTYMASKSVNPKDFKLLVDNFEPDVKTIDEMLVSLADDPSSSSGKVSYSYDLNKQDIMNSKFSASGKTLIDVITAFSVLFAIPEGMPN